MIIDVIKKLEIQSEVINTKWSNHINCKIIKIPNGINKLSVLYKEIKRLEIIFIYWL